MPTGQLMLIIVIAPIALFFLLVLVMTRCGLRGRVGRLLISATFAGALGAALPLMFLNFKATRTRKKMQDQFPVALDVFVRGLRAGHPIAAALDLLTVEMPDPIGSQFGLAVDEVTYGAELRDALQSMAERWNLDDMRMFVVSLSVQNETGGNLAEILENLSKVIRERQSMMMKVRALSSEGRMTAIMLTVFRSSPSPCCSCQPVILPRRRRRSLISCPVHRPHHHVFHRVLHHPQDGRFESLARCSSSSPTIPAADAAAGDPVRGRRRRRVFVAVQAVARSSGHSARLLEESPRVGGGTPDDGVAEDRAGRKRLAQAR